MHEVLANRLGGLSLPRKSVVRLTGRPDMTLDVYRGRKTTIQQQQQFMIANQICVWSSDRFRKRQAIDPEDGQKTDSSKGVSLKRLFQDCVLAENTL